MWAINMSEISLEIYFCNSQFSETASSYNWKSALYFVARQVQDWCKTILWTVQVDVMYDSGFW